MAAGAPVTTLSRVRQVSEMAEDGGEEIMFICEWPVPVPPTTTQTAGGTPHAPRPCRGGGRSVFAD